MIKKLLSLCFLILVVDFPIMAGAADDEEIYQRFLDYTQEVYLHHAQETFGENSALLYKFSDPLLGARVLGYSLGNLLQFAERGSENHATWLMLEGKTKEHLFKAIDEEGRLRRWERAFTEKRKEEAWMQFMAAAQGWLDPKMLILTGVEGNRVPNFFEILKAAEAEEEIEIPPALPQAGGEYTCEIKEYRDPDNPNRSGWIVEEKLGNNLIVHVGNDDKYRATFIKVFGEEAWNRSILAQELTVVGDWQDARNYAQRICQDWRNKDNPNYTCEIKEHRDPHNPNRAGWILSEEIGKHLIVHVVNNDDQYREQFIRVYGEAKWNSAGAMRWLRIGNNYQDALNDAQRHVQDWMKKNRLP